MKENDNSPYISQRNKYKGQLTIREIRWTDKQIELIKKIEDKNSKMIFVKGCAGTGKSYLAVYCGLKSVSEKKTSDLIYIRPIVESSEKSLGALPGELWEKIHPYGEILEEKLIELLPKNEIESLKNDRRIHILPVNYARGVHIAGKFVIIDEASSFTQRELLTLLTRIGEFTKVLILADPMQSDLHNGKGQAFSKIYNLFNDEEARTNGIYCYEFTKEDIVRSKLCRFIIEKFEQIDKKDPMFPK